MNKLSADEERVRFPKLLRQGVARLRAQGYVLDGQTECEMRLQVISAQVHRMVCTALDRRNESKQGEATMNLTIELTPEQESRLQREAARRGVAVADMVGQWADALPVETGPEPFVIPTVQTLATPAERAAAWMAWATQPRPETPPLPDAAFDRGNLYEDTL